MTLDKRIFSLFLLATLFAILVGPQLFAQGKRRRPANDQFIEAKGPQTPDRDAATLLKKANRHLSEWSVRLTMPGSESTVSRAALFDIGLAVLHAHKAPDPSEVFSRFIDSFKQVPVGAARDQAVVEAFAVVPHLDNRSESVERMRKTYDEINAAHRNQLGTALEPWPFNWQQRKDFWQVVARAAVRTPTEKDPALWWRAKAAELPADADRFRTAYLAVASASPGKPFAFDFVQPLVREEFPKDKPGLERLAFVLRAAARAGVAKDEPKLQRLWGRFLKAIRDPVFVKDIHKKFPVRACESLVAALVGPDHATVRERFLHQLLCHQHPDVFRSIASRILTKTEVDQRFYAKPISVHSRDMRVGLLLRTLREDVSGIPLWIDPAVESLRNKLTIDMDGPWRDVLRELARAGGVRVEPLQDGLFWVGPPSRQVDMTVDCGKMFVRSAVEDASTTKQGSVSASLRALVTFDFAQTPLADVVNFLHEFTGTNVVFLGAQDPRSYSVTMKVEQIPLGVALTCLVEPRMPDPPFEKSLETDVKRLDWNAANGVIALGTADRIEHFRELVVQYRLRRGAWRTGSVGESTVGSALQKPVSFDFSETPLSDVANFLTEFSGTPVVLGLVPTPDYPITLKLQAVPLDWAFELLTLNASLTWEADGTSIYLGTERAMTAWRRRADPAKRRAKYPAIWAEALTKPRTLEIKSAKLGDAVAELNRTIDPMPQPIRVDPARARLADEFTRSQVKNVPLEQILDALAFQVGGSWRFEPDGTITITGP